MNSSERRVSVVVINVRDRVHGYSPGQRLSFEPAKAKRLCEKKHPNGDAFAVLVLDNAEETAVRNAGGVDAYLAAQKEQAAKSSASAPVKRL